MPVSRLQHIPGIGVDVVGQAADDQDDPEILRLENLDTDIRPSEVALRRTIDAVAEDDANSYLPFRGHHELRAAAVAYVSARDGRTYDARSQCVSVAGGLNGILNVLLATVEPGDEVVIGDPVYAGLVNRIHLAGGVPVFVPAVAGPTGWTLEPDRLGAAVTERTAVVLTMSPTMPTGLVMDDAHWDALATLDHRPWVLHDAAMDRLHFGEPPPPPAANDRLADRVITVGSASKELRLIGWRVGWVVGPEDVISDVALVGLTNVVCQVGIAQQAVAAALTAPGCEDDVAAAVDTLRQRAELVLAELEGYPVIPPGGGWSMLLDTRPLGLSPSTLSERLLTRGKVAATPMDGWGPSGQHYLRIVYANETVQRLSGLRQRFTAAIG